MISIAIAALLLLGILIWALPGPCRCPNCIVHRAEDRVKPDAARAKRHRAAHRDWGVAWGDPKCGQCRLGNERDRE